MASKAEAEIEIIRKALTPVSSPRFFHFVMPKGKDWAGITIGAVMSALAFFFTVGGFYDGSTESLIAGLIVFSYPFYLLGALISACFPTGIEMAIRSLRDTTLKAKTVSFRVGPNGEKTESSKGTVDEGWLISPPKIKQWHMEEPYKQDDSGLLLEHPTKTGTAVPAIFTVRSLINLTKSLLLAISGALVFQATQNPDGLLFIFGVGLIVFILRYSKVKKWRAITDLPTSKIRSAAVGKIEVFGQIRPRKSWPPTINVDNDPSKQLFGMGAWYWEYGHEFSWEVWVEEKDEEGNVTGGRWESRSSYDKQRSNSGEWPMLVHDGTGGIAIQTGVLSGGRRIREWDRHDGSLWRRRPSGNVRNLEAKHVWYGTGWSMGDPLFFSGYASPRDNASLESESVDRTQAHALLELGKKGNSVGHAVTVHRGTELLALQEMESGIGALLPSFCMIVITGIPLLMYFL